MTPEEYQRIKEAEKEHLRKLKQLKEAMHLLERRKSVNQALENMVGGPKAVFDEHAELVEKLALETAVQEARLEIALENANLEETSPSDARRAPAPSEEASEEELLAARARSLLRQIKMEMGTPAQGDEPAAPASQERPAPRAESAPPPPPAGLPEKTIGRMK